MDMNLFRKHLFANKQKLSGPPQARSIAVRLLDLPKYLSNHDRLEEIDSIYADLDSIPNLSSKTKKQLQANLDELTQAVRRQEFDDAEILIGDLVTLLKKS
jgi:hypothetical protein